MDSTRLTTESWCNSTIGAQFNVANLPGLHSHFNIKSHTDGSFQSLYLWLRYEGDVSRYPGGHISQRAYNAAIDPTENHIVTRRCRDGARRHFADVTSVAR